MRHAISIVLVSFLVMTVCESAANAEAPYSLQWGRQFGTNQQDQSQDVTVDSSGNVFVTGFTDGNLNGQINHGGDAFVSKYNGSGTLLWSRLIGSSLTDLGYGIATDSFGNAYIGGRTAGSFGGPNAGGIDAFVSKLDVNGNMMWTRQFGTSGYDEANRLTLDGGGSVYVTGITFGNLDGQSNSGGYDGFIRKMDANGNLLWTKLVGTSADDSAGGVTVDPSTGAIYLVGGTSGNLGGQPNNGQGDAFIRRYDSAGAVQWTRLLGGTFDDGAGSVVADGLGHIYLAGDSGGGVDGQIGAGATDTLIAKYETDGTKDWTRIMGTPGQDYSCGVAFDSTTGAIFTGHYSLPGNNTSDSFLSKWDATGSVVWSEQIGPTDAFADACDAITTDSLGAAYVAGRTSGVLYGPYAGGPLDATIAKFAPEPASAALLLIACLVMPRRRSRRTR